MKKRPIIFNDAMVRAIMDGRKTQTRRIVKPQTITPMLLSSLGWKDAATGKAVSCPFGQPGDRLWVRECWCQPTEHKIAWYRSCGLGSEWGGEIRWRPSIHMPRWASRITLEVTGVRVERLQDISVVDAHKEGAPDLVGADTFKWFVGLWESIYGVESWQSNPWVWVIEFRRVEK